MRKRMLCALCCACLLLTGCAGGGGETAGGAATATAVQSTAKDPAIKTTGNGFYFDTVVTFTLYGADDTLLADLQSACERYEALLSRTIAQSDVGRINAAEGKSVTVDAETARIITRAKEISAMTDRAFCVTIAPLTTLWDFSGGTERMPTEAERMAALPLVDDDKLTVEGNEVTLPAGMEIDLGGIAKGYIADVLSDLCRTRAAGALLNFGGNVYVVGSKPDGSPFRVGVRDPADPASSIAVVSLAEGTVVTSGIYERCFTKDGVFYHHILDPGTGLPSQSDLSSVSIIGQSSMDADALCTACIVLGRDKALALLQEKGIDAMLIDREDQITFTDGFAEKYAVQLVKQ